MYRSKIVCAAILAVLFATQSCSKCEQIVCYKCDSPMLRITGYHKAFGKNVVVDNKIEYWLIVDPNVYDTFWIDTLNIIRIKETKCFGESEIETGSISPFFDSKYCSVVK